MSMGRAFFGFNGRLPRAEYIGLSLVAAIVLLILFFAIAGMLSSGRLDTAITVYFAASAWVGGALVAKRLHDMGYSGAHAIWIMPVQLAAGWYGRQYMILWAVAVSLGLYLVFTRGEGGNNAYGPEPQ
jgi:uncharacterized membrane protein YhaH (DUF805 family)